jgi:polyferredoxin
VTHVLRFRTFVYAGLLVLMTAGLLYSVVQRLPLEMDIIRDRNALFRDTGDGNIENIYTLKVINMDSKQHEFSVSVAGIEGVALRGAETIKVDAGRVAEVPVKVIVNPDHMTERSQEVMFHIEAKDDASLAQTQKARLLGPKQ